jgi:hypothetical protein
VVIATIFLIIIGMSGGLALAARHKDRSAAQTPLDNTPAVVVTTAAPTGEPTPDGPPCTSHTQEIAPQYGAQGQLTIVLRLVTAKSTVWICRDTAGELFYHANKGGEDAGWVEGQTALFMKGVRAVGDQYVVTSNDGVTFRVDRRQLEIVHKDGRIETQKASR